MVCAAPPYINVLPGVPASIVGVMVVVPLNVSVPEAPCVRILGVELASVVVTVMFPLLVVFELISSLASVPVPLMVWPAVVMVRIVMVVLVSAAFKTNPPVVVITAATVPVILPPGLTVSPPVPTFVVTIDVQFPVPSIVNDLQLLAALIVTVYPLHMITSSVAVGAETAAAPPQPAVDQVEAVPHAVFALE